MISDPSFSGPLGDMMVLKKVKIKIVTLKLCDMLSLCRHRRGLSVGLRI